MIRDVAPTIVGVVEIICHLSSVINSRNIIGAKVTPRTEERGAFSAICILIFFYK